ncbi:G1/S-specific cyclin CLN2 [Xylona heveae TC161]|uniref:G1/S-specific cyclin CLN2 n=1 Tax=Xylona heveae (strain CBS 132557 / TC161) TaxID=1328760 RepID=A0A161TPM7_XYLHT|nr:G1/S-specific cyclin CLN2 [Xylona heveae TC161]KZF24186.1 G1/S-specific cyclin CLN2 [Xylona heveae TC161]
MSYPQCDSYFVETHDNGYYAAQAESRERTKLVNRARQNGIAAELSKIASEEYKDDVLEHMEQMEAETLPDVASIDIQTEIQWFMRPYLLDFLIEAHSAFQLLPETLFLAINLLDRYCSKRVVYKRHYQLVGCASLLVAAKYGDRKDRIPTISELKSICCSLYDDDMFIQMEWHVLQTLNWIIGHPTVDNFIQLLLSESTYDPEVEHMTRYICEISLFHKEFVSIRPSVLARSALALARCILGRVQPHQSEWAGQYDSLTVVTLSQQLHRPTTVLARKYASSHLSHVSRIMEEFLLRQASIAKRYAPPTPQCETPSEQKLELLGEFGPHTPEKGHYPLSMPSGYMTPPITPNGGNFEASQHEKAYGPGRRTASPQQTVHQPQQYTEYTYQQSAW